MHPNECTFEGPDILPVLTNGVKKIQPDKWKHFLAGIILGGILQALVLYFFSFPLAVSSGISLAATLVTSYGFELFSLVTGKGHYEVMDAVASVIGGVLGITGMTIIDTPLFR